MSGDYLSVTPFWAGSTTESDIVELIQNGIEFRIPRNWLAQAAFLPGNPALIFSLHCTYPDLKGVTLDNSRIFPSLYMTDRVTWDRVAILAEPARMNSRPRLPQSSGGQLTEREAKTALHCHKYGVPWFNGDGFPIRADQEHGLIKGWTDFVEADEGIIFRVSYGTPLVEHWRDIRDRLTQIFAGFVVGRLGGG